MLDHISLGVTDFAKAKAFYTAVLAPLGHVVLHEDTDSCGFGPEHGNAGLWLGAEDDAATPAGFHIAFLAPTRAAVDAFYEQALAHGGCDNGAPGLRPAYGPTYYAAFVIEPDGYHLEAVHGRF